jgi:hypothetical protein
MSVDECNMQQLVSRLRTVHFHSYLLSHGWVETPSPYVDQLRFEGNTIDGEGVYEMFLPASADVAKYQTRLLRNLYKLCGIEDREPAEIAQEIIASCAAAQSTDAAREATRLRVHNSGSNPLRVRINAPEREHILCANEAIELMCCIAAGETLGIERSDKALVIRTLAHQ